uniref:Uncharacterized protein n=1 Tax=Panagrolaimus sp. JU765 TaxID=591449 RepID=A0AC34QVJ4_9BILA
MKKLKLFLIPWTFSLFFNLICAQKLELPDLNSQFQSLVQRPAHRPLYELISPLNNLHVLHQAIAITPAPIFLTPTNHPLAALHNLQFFSTPSPVFSPNKKLLTVTVPLPNHESQPDSIVEFQKPPVAVPPPTTKKDEEKDVSIKALSTTTFTDPETEHENKTLPGFPPISSDSSDVDSFNAEIDQLNETMENNQANISKDINPTTESTTSTSTVATTTTSKQNSVSATSSSIPESSTTAPIIKNLANSSGFHLTERLENKNIESFLATANISTNEAQTFLKLVEKVLEEEVSKRLKEHEKTSTLPPTISSTKPEIQPLIEHDELQQILLPEKLEMKTVNRRLNYETDISDRVFSLSEVMNSQQNKPIDSAEKPVSAIREHIQPLPKVSTSNFKDYRSRNRVNQAGVQIEDFKDREQAEFDSLIGRNNNFRSEEFKSVTTVAPKQNTFPPKTIIPMHTISLHSQPMTNFQRLVKDYQFRLSGQSNFNDLIKAFRNAKIGFYERPTFNRYKKQPQR